MTITVTKRHVLFGVAALFLLALVIAVVARVPLTGLAIGKALKSAGATDAKFQVAQVSPWRVAVKDVAFVVDQQPVAAKEVVVERRHWWTPSLGRVRIGQARLELRVDELAGRPPAEKKQPDGPVRVPAEEISIDGQLILRVADVPDQALTVKIDARKVGADSWTANTDVIAPGLTLKGAGTYNLANGDLALKLPEVALDLKTWEGFLAKLAPAPAALDWATGGKFGGSLEAQLADGKFTAGGNVVVQAADGQDHALTVAIDAQKAGTDSWSGRGQVTASGLTLKGEGTYDFASGDVAFKLPEMAIDLKTWQGLLRQGMPEAGKEWEMEGKFSGSAEGRRTGGKLSATGKIRLREGRGASTAQGITAEGIETDLEFTDFEQVTTKPGTLVVRELRTSQLTMRDLRWEFSVAGPDRIDVSHASLTALGGSISAEPFRFTPSRAELDAVLLVENISVEEVMALTKDLPARASGRVNGRVPMSISADGVQFGSGWLELKPGVHAEIQFNTQGLLTGGAAPNTPTYAVLQQVETGLLKLKINELRLDIRPPNAPEGRSAELRLAGEPLDKNIKAPVRLDLNVNGPLEQLLNMGLDSRLSFGGGK